jgi:hypothetical protein
MATRRTSPSRKKKAARSKEWVVFIDTCVLLDFYRSRGSRNTLSILDHVDGNHHRIITTSQVEIDMTNRPRGSSSLATSARPASRPVPTFLASRSRCRCWERRSRVQPDRKVRDRTGRLIADPGRQINLQAPSQTLLRWSATYTRIKERRRIRARARTRYSLGYPPRKAGDTSMGDAINWEWVVHCAQVLTSANVVIVSRDSDYGHEHGGKAHINDWLREEFKDRVSRQRDIDSRRAQLTDLGSLEFRRRRSRRG